MLSNNDGCAIARSNEAKALDIPMGAPAFEWWEYFQAHNVKVLSSNYELYGDISDRVYRALKHYSPEIEKYSIDESFLCLPDIVNGKVLKREMYRSVGIPVSVGVGPTKTLAKVANHLAKKRSQYQGVYYSPEGLELDSVLDTMAVKDLWGIGSRWAKKLNGIGIHTVKDLKYADDRWVKKNLNIVGLRTVHELRGVPCLELEETPPDKKNTACTRSFGSPIESLTELREAVAFFASTASARLRRGHQVCSFVSVFVSTKRFGTGPHYSRSFNTVLAEPTAFAPVIVKTAMKCLERIYRDGYKYKQAGVFLSGLGKNSTQQIDLFDARDSSKDTALMAAFDQINARYGRGSLTLGAEGINPQWVMKQTMKTPRYTTRLEELRTVN